MLIFAENKKKLCIFVAIMLLLIQVIMNIGTHFSGQPMYGQLIDLLSKRYSIRDVAKLSGKSVSTVQRVKQLLTVQSSQ